MNQLSVHLQGKHRLLPIIAGILNALIFGFSFLFTKQTLMVIKPFELLAHRFTLASLLLFLLIFTKTIKVRLSWSLIYDLLPLAFVQPILYFLGETYGVKYTSASESGIIISLIPVAVSFLGVHLLNERVKMHQWLLILLSASGVVLIVLSGSGYTFKTHLLGIAFLLLAVIAAAIYNILSRKSSRKYTPIEITIVMMVTSAIFFNCLHFFTLKPHEMYFAALLKGNSLIALLYLGIASSVGAFFLMNYMLKEMPAFQVAAFMNLTTVISVFAGVIFRNENFSIYHIIGGILILGGVSGVNLTGNTVNKR